MRARYVAYVKGEVDYLLKTTHLLERRNFDRNAAKAWSESSEWLGLEVLSAQGSGTDKKGRVEFVASFTQEGVEHKHHEVSRFEKQNDRWFYVDGKVYSEEGGPVPTTASSQRWQSLR